MPPTERISDCAAYTREPDERHELRHIMAQRNNCVTCVKRYVAYCTASWQCRPLAEELASLNRRTCTPATRFSTVQYTAAVVGI